MLNNVNLLIITNISDSTHQNGPVGQEVQMDFLLFPTKSLFIQLNFGVKSFEIGHCMSEIPRYGNFNDVIIFRWKVDFEKRLLKVWESGLSIVYITNQKSIFTWKHCLMSSTASSNLESKYWGINFGTILWDILTLHPCNTKWSFPTAGTFWYVELHTLTMYLIFDACWEIYKYT